jgi:hypothetical protein
VCVLTSATTGETATSSVFVTVQCKFGEREREREREREGEREREREGVHNMAITYQLSG